MQDTSSPGLPGTAALLCSQLCSWGSTADHPRRLLLLWMVLLHVLPDALGDIKHVSPLCRSKIQHSTFPVINSGLWSSSPARTTERTAAPGLCSTSPGTSVQPGPVGSPGCEDTGLPTGCGSVPKVTTAGEQTGAPPSTPGSVHSPRPRFRQPTGS